MKTFFIQNIQKNEIQIAVRIARVIQQWQSTSRKKLRLERKQQGFTKSSKMRASADLIDWQRKSEPMIQPDFGQSLNQSRSRSSALSSGSPGYSSREISYKRASEDKSQESLDGGSAKKPRITEEYQEESLSRICSEIERDSDVINVRRKNLNTDGSEQDGEEQASKEILELSQHSEQEELSSDTSVSKYLEAGIENVGNTCYAGSSIKAIMCLNTFVSRIMEMKEICEFMDIDIETLTVIHEFGKLKESMAGTVELTNTSVSRYRKSVNPELFLNSIEQRYPDFRKRQLQHDAHEWLLALFDSLDTDLSKSLGSGADPLGLGITIDRYFSLVTRRQMKCTSCGDFSGLPLEKHWIYSIDLHNQVQSMSLNHLSKRVQALPDSDDGKVSARGLENLEENSDTAGAAQPLCDILKASFLPSSIDSKCKKCSKQSLQIVESIAMLPRILCFQLKRFRGASYLNTNEFSYEKVHRRVSLPLELDLSDLELSSNAYDPSTFDEMAMKSGNPSFSSLLQELGKSDREVEEHKINAKYTLSAVVEHIGLSPDSGHYLTISKQTDSNGTEYWTKWNDSLCQRICNIEEYLNDAEHQMSSYILFYSYMEPRQS
mmetsp:Transcript_11980/g.21697  ORF Transcript_11980/g.21697 Transcript_11980/m.21697 type:complete len:605 (-) Transcript_11980:150-1964(-)